MTSRKKMTKSLHNDQEWTLDAPIILTTERTFSTTLLFHQINLTNKHNRSTLTVQPI